MTALDGTSLVLAVLLALPQVATADSQWVLETSTLTYHVSHPLHDSTGSSHAARGKGICRAEECEFLIAVPVKSFESGDSNRDLHMIQATHGAEFPIVTVRARLPERAMASGTIHADLDIEFAGHSAHYSQVALQRVMEGTDAHIAATIPATLSDFKIAPPTLLAMPVKNEMPLTVEMSWKRQ